MKVHYSIMHLVERKSGYAVIAKVSNKTAELVGQAIIKALRSFEVCVKTLTYDNRKEFCGHALINEALTSIGHFRAGSAVQTKVSMVFYAKMCRRSGR